MPLKIDTNQSATAFHVNDGAVLFPYAIDAQHAISSHPLEWSMAPWSREDADAARKELAARYESDVEDANARGLPPPAPPPPAPPPLTAEDQAALDEYNKSVAEASERLAAYNAKKEAERLEVEQVAEDERLLASVPPAPTIKRPFGRTGDPTPAEIEAANRRAAKKAAEDQAAAEKKAADDKLVQDKAAQDALAGNSQASKI